MTVTREGKFTRSGVEEVDEAEIFEGAENRLTMNQTYTWGAPLAIKISKIFVDLLPFFSSRSIKPWTKSLSKTQ